MTESHAVAIKERDAADEGRRKLEKTLSEFLTRFASVRETQSAAFKEVEKLQDTRRELEKRNEELMSQLTKADEIRVKSNKDLEQRVLDLNAQLAGTEEAWNKVKKERDDLQARVDKQEQEVAQARAELNKFREMAVASLEPLGVDHNRMMKKLYSEADTMMTQMLQARDEAAQKYEAMCKMADELKANITSSRKELSQKFSMVIGGPAGESGTRPAITAAPPAAAPDSTPSAAPVAMAS
jgi:chromosome segregation ATPase